MHGIRSAIIHGKGRYSDAPAAGKEPCRRREASKSEEAGAEEILLHDRRAAAQRGEDRHVGVAEHATLIVRGKQLLARVVNLSAGGATIETQLPLQIGDSVVIAITGGNQVSASVRWVTRGRVGLGMGEIQSKGE